MAELYVVKPRIMAGIILDCSGSMEAMRREAIGHFNETVQAMRDHAEGVEARVSLVTFNHKLSCPIFNEPVEKARELADEQYIPSGGTALYDAVIYTIHRFKKEILEIGQKHTSVMISVITDGEENSSVHYPGERGRKLIKNQISRLEQTGRWSFTFMGADRRVIEEAVQHLGFSRGNTSLYQATSSGMSRASRINASSSVKFIDAVKRSQPAPKDLYEDSRPSDPGGSGGSGVH